MKKLNVLLSFFLAGYSLSAQPSQTSFLHYTTEQGLSHDHITAISKDYLGFLWVGTVNGLNRFDGRTFKIFRHDPNDPGSIPHDQIIGITPAPDGWLWITTLEGLCKLDPVWLSIHRIPSPDETDPLMQDVFSKVAFDTAGMVWTTGEKGIYKINPATNKVEYFFKTEEKSLGSFQILPDHRNRVWLISDRIRLFNPFTQTLTLLKGTDPENPLSEAGGMCVTEDDAGDIWAGTWNKGIWKLDPSAEDFAMHSVNYSLAMMLLPDKTAAGRSFFWVGGGLCGLLIYYPDTKQLTEFLPDPRDPFTHNNYLAKTMYRDPSNQDIWIGTEVGLEHYAPTAIRFGRAMIPVEKDMGQFSLVSGVIHDRTDPDGQRYFITLWGSSFFEWNKATGRFNRFRLPGIKMAGGSNFYLFQDHQGYVWGCMRNGIGRYYPPTGEWKDYENFFRHNERNNVFFCGMADRKRNVWFGSNKEGLYRYAPDADLMEQVLYDTAYTNSEGYMNVMGMSEDTLGHLWLACNAAGLVRYNPVTGATKNFAFTDKNISQVCNAVEIGHNGHIYAAFYNSFLELDAHGNLIRYFNEKNGLKSHRIYFMVEDKQGKIWFTTEYLLHCFDPVTSSFTYYGKADGLFSNTMTDALTITPGGEIFVGFQNAFNYFYPDRIRRNLQPPQIAITSIKVMNKERQVISAHSRKTNDKLLPPGNIYDAEENTLILKPGEDFFEVEFAALNFNQQERNRYAYLLEGFNKDWVYTDRPVATFTNLDGGTYLLRMKAANNDGVWNEQGATLTIRVNPPFHRTWWFPVVVVLAATSLLFGFLMYRRHQRHRLEKFREGLARDLHDEMGSTLSSIRFFSEFANQKIGNDQPEITPVLQRISQSASNLSESMQDIVWAMKTQNDELEDLTAHMTEFGLRLMESRNVHFKTHFSEDLSGKHLPPEVRRNLYLIFKEAVNNAAKYSEARDVDLYFTIKRGWLTLALEDNGKGFEIDKLSETVHGNGLHNMYQRAMDIGGKLDITSSPGKGTRVELKMKI